MEERVRHIEWLYGTIVILILGKNAVHLFLRVRIVEKIE